MKKRKWWLIILIIITLVLAIRLITQEDDWICVDGEWVEHGVPKVAKPTGYCIAGKVNNFKECVASGNSVIESYPRKCKYLDDTFTEIIEHFCLNENLGEFCMTLYDPVCGYPLKETFSNSCFACQNKEMVYWTQGECI